MPARDGSGPMGQGPMTGRGMGNCRSSFGSFWGRRNFGARLGSFFRRGNREYRYQNDFNSYQNDLKNYEGEELKSYLNDLENEITKIKDLIKEKEDKS